MISVELGDALMLAGAVSAPLGIAWRVMSGLAAAQVAINAALEHRVARLERVTDKM